MKILKRIVTGIGIIVVLLCALILLCAINPNITKKLEGLFTRNGKQAEDVAVYDIVAAEETGFLPESQVSDNGDSIKATDSDTTNESADSKSAVTSTQTEQENNTLSTSTGVVRGSNGYEVPSETDIVVPEAVSGKSGYQPIKETSVELPGAEGGEYTSELGYGETGDGLTFDPVFYPYYYMLDAEGQHLYRQIFANAGAFNKAFVPVEAVPVSKIRDVICAVYNDHPELFWLNTAYVCKYDKNKICAELELDFNEAADDLENTSREFNNTVNNILTQVQNLGSNYEKEKRVHDLLIEEVSYNKAAKMNQSAYSALVEGESVCAGYARAYQYLLQKLGIPCYYCTGYAGVDHAWNIVALEDGYYNVDVTWDDTPGGEYDYFNKTDEEYADTHVREELSVNLPVCGRQQ